MIITLKLILRLNKSKRKLNYARVFKASLKKDRLPRTHCSIYLTFNTGNLGNTLMLGTLLITILCV